jgi:hypothetical protein
MSSLCYSTKQLLSLKGSERNIKPAKRFQDLLGPSDVSHWGSLHWNLTSENLLLSARELATELPIRRRKEDGAI